MRLNRGTIILLVAAVAVIVLVLVLDNSQPEAPAETQEPLVLTAESIGPVFPDVAQAAVVRVAVTNNETGANTLLLKDDAGGWTIAEATNSTDRAPNEAEILNQVGALAGLTANDRFEVDNLADFGLDTPSYVLSMSTEDGQTYTIYVGDTNPAGNRYYVMVTSGATPADLFSVPTAMPETTDEPAATEEVAEATDEAAPDAESTPEPTPPYTGVTLSEPGTVYLVLQSTIRDIVAMIATPPYVAAPTATPTLTATLNPLSEVEQATATAEFFATSTAVIEEVAATATARAAATAEATPEATQAP